MTATISSTLSAVASLHELSQSPAVQLLSRSVKPALGTDFSEQRIEPVSESNQSPEFAQFLQTVKQAVRDRDAKFIRSIVTPGTHFSFGEHRSINYLNPDNPNSPFWSQLEKAIAAGCTNEATLFSCASSRSAVDSLSYRATFGQQNGKWTMQAFVSND